MNCRRQLERHFGTREGNALYRAVMEDCFNLSQTDVLLGKDTEISQSDKLRLKEITCMLLKNVPLQYILGYTNFCGHRFVVRRGCLIPRPETEWLVREILLIREGRSTSCPGNQTIDTVLDIGTGSGCIAISLALHGFRVTATDISAEALEIARQNADKLGADIDFVNENILHPQETCRCWDVIVSNPPYVMPREIEHMDHNVLDYEPHLALFAPADDPLLFYRHISQYALQHLNPEGWLLFEINHLLSDETANLVKKTGFRDVCIKNDIYEKGRFLVAHL